MSLREMLSDYWYAFQQELFPRLESELGPMGERYDVNRLSILTPNRRAKLTPLSGTAEVVPVVNRGDPRGFV